MVYEVTQPDVNVTIQTFANVSVMMATYWTEDGSTPPVITANRQRLVEQFNRTVGTPAQRK